jgi:COP9 signalosome complex subunit 2
MSSSEEEYVYSSGSDNGGDAGGGDNDSDQDSNKSEGEVDPDVELENKYWEADDVKKTAPQEALEAFLFYIKQDTARFQGEIAGKPKAHLELKDVGIGYFHALYEVTLIYFKLGQYDNMLEYMRKLLNFLPEVTRNERQKAIENILRAMSNGSAGDATPENQRVLVDTYRLTLEVLENLNIDARLTFSTKKSLGQIYLQMSDITNVETIVHELHVLCKDPKTGQDDLRNRAEWMLETTALELQLCALTKDKRRRQQLHQQTKLLSHAIVDPTTMGVIHEDCGKMLMGEKKWTEAYQEFFSGFSRHSETANPRARECLKYVVLANMLSLSNINPFSTKEASAYQDAPVIQAMIQLREAYTKNDAKKFESILRDPKINLLSDTFLAEYVDDLLQKTRQQILRDFVKPYRRVKLDAIAEELNVSTNDVEPILVKSILDGTLLHSKIDQGKGVLVVGRNAGSSGMSAQWQALSKWADAIAALNGK